MTLPWKGAFMEDHTCSKGSGKCRDEEVHFGGCWGENAKTSSRKQSWGQC